MFFRQAFPFADSKTRIAVSADDLDGEIEDNCFATALQDIDAYRVEKRIRTMAPLSFESGAATFYPLAKGLCFRSKVPLTLCGQSDRSWRL